MDKTFSLERQNEEKQPHYKDQILHIINEHEAAIRAITPEGDLDAESHGTTQIENKEEWRDFEKVRTDVCEAFGVTPDSKHLFIYERDNEELKSETQRALRAFCVVIDALKKEAYYGDGRIDHYSLFNELVTRINKGKLDYAAMRVFYGEHEGPSRYLFFKGFIDNRDFASLSPESSNLLRTPIFDSEGNEIETPLNWFVTGHNLQNHPGNKA